jgi:hypothetical protein
MPEFSCLVPLAIKDCLWAPVLWLFREKIATLQQEDFSAAITQRIRQCTSPHPRPDNDQIESVHFQTTKTPRIEKVS